MTFHVNLVKARKPSLPFIMLRPQAALVCSLVCLFSVTLKRGEVSPELGIWLPPQGSELQRERVLAQQILIELILRARHGTGH